MFRLLRRQFSTSKYKFDIVDTVKAHDNMKDVVINTPLQLNTRLSQKYNSRILIKREDLQNVRSFKIRGAFNKIVNLSNNCQINGIVCASAGNHAQGVALSASMLDITADIFIPENTPKQKVERINKTNG